MSVTSVEQTTEQKNFVLNCIEGALFSASGAFMSPQTVLPVIVVGLGGSNVAVGAISVIVWVGLFLPQVFAARYVETLPWKKPWAIRFGIAQRIAVLCIALALFLFTEEHTNLALVLFFVFFAACQVLLGVTMPGWFDMFAKMIPTRRRGRLVGIRSSLGGVGAFCCGLILTWLLGRYAFPVNFAIAFLLAFLLQAVSIVVQTRLVEARPSPTVERKALFLYLRKLPGIFRDNVPFRNLMIAVVFQILAGMPTGFYAVYAISRFALDDAAVGGFTLAIVGVQVLSSLAIGHLADRRGNKTVLVLAAGALLGANVWAALAPSAGWFVMVFVFLGVNLGTELLARYNITIEYSPPELRSTYVGLMNTVVAPFYLAGMLAGKISDILGYEVLFWIGSVTSVLGLLTILLLVREPREYTQELVVTES